jgi:phage major head subunit gpT-like protein
MPTPQLGLQHDASQAVIEFSQEFDSVFVAAPSDQWSRQFGLVVPGKFRHTIPIPIDAPGYVERSGDDGMRELYARSLSFEPKEWVDGVTVKASMLEGPDFIGWNKAPTNMAQEALRHPDQLVATMLEANPLLDFYRVERRGGSVASTIHLFDALHPVNVFETSRGVQSNLIAQGSYVDFTEALLTAVVGRFRAWQAANGRPMHLVPSHVLVPAGRLIAAQKFFARDTLLEAVKTVAGTENVGAVLAPNVFQNTIVPVVVDEFTDADYVYFVCASAASKPWALQDGGAPEEIVYDKTSDHYKNTGFVGIKYILTQGVAGCLPHAIMRVDLKSTAR